MSSSLWRTFTGADLPNTLDVPWLWEKLIPQNLVSFIGGSAGTGKSLLVWALALSVAVGRPFLEAEVEHGTVHYYDFDSEPGAQGHVMHKVRRGLRIPPRDVAKRLFYHAPGAEGVPLLDDARLASVADEVRAAGPALVVIDAWTSAFWNVRSNDTEQVAAKMAELRALAKLGTAVLVIDHAPKPIANAPNAVDRGLIGSTMKLAGSRAGYLLARVPPREVDGRDVGALHTLKNNLGPIHDPLGVERTWHEDAVTFEVTDLPEAESGATGRMRAEAAVREMLDPDDLVEKADLHRAVIERANVQTRTVEAAVARLIANGEVTAEKLQRDGRRKGYRLAAAEDPS
jgi:hypothetical protein